MRKAILLGAALALLCAGAVAPARAEIELQKVDWQTARWERGKTRKPEPVEALAFDPGKRIPDRVQARLTVLNRGPVVKGVLLRYAMTGKVAPKDKSQPAAWSLPFMIDQKRVPNLKANQHAEIVLDTTDLLALYLRRVHRTGWWPEELKLEVMVEPRNGQSVPLKILTASLPVQP